jgi:hypothetical protein
VFNGRYTYLTDLPVQLGTRVMLPPSDGRERPWPLTVTDPHHVWKAATIGDHADVAVNAMAKCANVDPQSPGASHDRGNTPSAAWPTCKYADARAMMDYTRGDLND